MKISTLQDLINRALRYLQFRVDLWAMERVQKVAQQFYSGVKTGSPLVMFFANEAASFIEYSGGKNCVITGFHSDRIDRDIIFSVRYQDGKTIEELFLNTSQELKIAMNVLEERDQILRAIPQGENIGKYSVPHALEWVRESIEIREVYRIKDDVLDRMEAALQAIDTWTKAYPLSVFPQPSDEDLKRAQSLLEAGGISYTALNAYTMRHVIQGVANLVKEGLGSSDEDLYPIRAMAFSPEAEKLINLKMRGHHEAIIKDLVNMSIIPASFWDTDKPVKPASWVEFSKVDQGSAEEDITTLSMGIPDTKDITVHPAIQKVSGEFQIGIDKGSPEGDTTVKSVICGNCGVYRLVDDLSGFIVEKCGNCGDDEYDLYANFEDIP